MTTFHIPARDIDPRSRSRPPQLAGSTLDTGPLKIFVKVYQYKLQFLAILEEK